jgi:hypothetical protein
VYAVGNELKSGWPDPMEKEQTSISPYIRRDRPKQCLSCGCALNGGRRRYCSGECRETLVFWLGWISDILRPVGTMYATFHFTESELILHVLPFASRKVSTYIYPRTPSKRPAQDIRDMVLELNEAWWKERRRTRCRRNASEHVLEKGEKNVAPPEAVKPVVMRGPTALKKHLTELKITADNLSIAELQIKIKSAYRKQAMKHHPDRGGDEEMFKKISEAYVELNKWLENPSYRTRRGVPGKWSYDGARGRWGTPL